MSYQGFMKGEPIRRQPNRYEIADVISKGLYQKGYDTLTLDEKRELVRFLACYSPLFR